MAAVDRRTLLALASAGAATLLPPGQALARDAQPAAPAGGLRTTQARVPQWDIHELALPGPQEGNPFRDVQLSAVFSQGTRQVEVRGFYDGAGRYLLRFMPDQPGPWRYRTHSTVLALDGHDGAFECVAPRHGAHGPVAVHQMLHFAHADGTPYLPFGTTCYAWLHQSEALQRQTLAALQASPFNKLRMCVFPKHYEYNHNEPPLYPFERDPASGKSDFSRPNPAFYRHLEAQLAALRALGIEVDLILFHPYDRWGYASMPADDDDHYLRYLLARLSAHANVWWSVANEFDLMKAKTVADFDRLLLLAARLDPYSHLRSVHHSRTPYDTGHPAITHASLQTTDFSKTASYIETFRKPVVYDEVQYEGNLNRRWGNLSGPEQTWRFWRGVIAGAYVSHGETLLAADAPMDEDTTPTLWWSHGGTLRGSSPPRIAFLRHLVQDMLAAKPGAPALRPGLQALKDAYYPCAAVLRADGKTVAAQLYFLDYHQPVWYEFTLPEGRFAAELIDPWAMTVTPVAGHFTGKAKLQLTGRPYQAIRFTRQA